MESRNYIRKKKIELLNQLNKYKLEGYMLSKNYSINSSIYDLEFELDLIKKKIQDEEKDLIFKRFLYLSENFKDSFDKTKETSEENTETANTIHNNLSKEFSGNKKIMQKVAENFIDGFTNKFIDFKLIDEKDKHKTTNLLKVLSTMLISNNKTLDLY